MVQWINVDADLQNLFEPAWKSLQLRHGELPPVVFEAMPPGVGERLGGRGGVVAMTALPGHPRPDGTAYLALTIVAYPGWLLRSPRQAFEALMHEAAHVIDYARNGFVSGHSTIFASVAGELGLQAVQQHEGPWAGEFKATITNSALAMYAETIEALERRREQMGAASWVT